MKYAKIKKTDVANGPGVRVSIFVSGCHHHCEGCFNSEAWDFNYGNDFTEDTIQEIIEAMNHDYITGLSLLGGEPFELINQKGLLPLLKKVKEVYPDKTIWAYSGFLYDELKEMDYPETKEILSLIDVLVDGKFVESLKDPNLYFRGSSNQRVIDMKKTLKNNKIVLHEKNARRN
ncbi:MAG: anaerobic ribonucleoside-triphosphate reductase activating protein [Bacilli bacterium]